MLKRCGSVRSDSAGAVGSAGTRQVLRQGRIRITPARRAIRPDTRATPAGPAGLMKKAGPNGPAFAPVNQGWPFARSAGPVHLSGKPLSSRVNPYRVVPRSLQVARALNGHHDTMSTRVFQHQTCRHRAGRAPGQAARSLVSRPPSRLGPRIEERPEAARLPEACRAHRPGRRIGLRQARRRRLPPDTRNIRLPDDR